MDNKTVKMAGVIAGIVVVLGVLVIGAQYLKQTTGGASAQVTNFEQLPPTLSVTKEDYVTIVSQLDAYDAASDLATKNQIVKGLRTIVQGLVK